MKRIEFGEIKIGPVAKRQLDECFNSNRVTLGMKVKELEEKWASLLGCRYAVGTSSGTTACTAAASTLYEFGAKRGDQVIVPALGFIATATAVVHAGLEPVFCDIKKETLNIDETLVEDLITDKTVAIMPVTTMGKPYNVKALRAICDEHKLLLISDNCEGAGCQVNYRFIESYSDMSTVSMYAAHICFAVEFGMVSTDSEQIRDLIISLRSHGRKPHDLYFDHVRLGGNFKPTDLHACVGLESVENFWHNFRVRKEVWRKIYHGLERLKDYVYFSEEDPGEINSPHAFSVVVKDVSKVDKLKDALDHANVSWKRNFGCSPHHQCFDYLPRHPYPNAEFVGEAGLHWGCHQYMTDNDVDRIVDVVSGALKPL